ncbi:nudC domain-containing protein 2 isoform X2 [Pseudophryne corroboree]|uniref:nudC domain-containing protein 2 isoform X2 n=1 Tax=Pseudophryne corroboree TaxID=495146 RepID=UPI003081801C
MVTSVEPAIVGKGGAESIWEGDEDAEEAESGFLRANFSRRAATELPRLRTMRHTQRRNAEDKKLIRIVLTKCNRDAGNCWPSLLEDEYSADPWIQDEMQKKLTLERFQRENPGFDFSGADISGNYSKGGPDFSNLQK